MPHCGRARNAHPGYLAKLTSGYPDESHIRVTRRNSSQKSLVVHHTMGGTSKPCNTAPHCGSDGNVHPGTLAKLTSWRNSHRGETHIVAKLTSWLFYCPGTSHGKYSNKGQHSGREGNVHLGYMAKLTSGTLTKLTLGLPGETQIRNPLWFTTPYVVPVNPAIQCPTVAVREMHIRVPWRNSHLGETHIWDLLLPRYKPW